MRGSGSTGISPVIIMLDEIGKAMEGGRKNALLTLMLEHRIGDSYAPERGSIVFWHYKLVDRWSRRYAGSSRTKSCGIGYSSQTRCRMSGLSGH